MLGGERERERVTQENNKKYGRDGGGYPGVAGDQVTADEIC